MLEPITGDSPTAFACAFLSPHNSNQLASIKCPCSVRTDSGWNWTPCIGSVLCCIDIITPDSVALVISKTSGTDSFIYLNGVQVANGSINNVSISKPFVFNTRYTNDGSSLTDSRGSQFSHIAVYSRALSATEVKQIYNATKRRFGY